MANRFLLIPGTGGVNFRTPSGARASYIFELLMARFQGWNDDLVAELCCEHAGGDEDPWAPTRTSLSDEQGELSPGDVLLASAYDVVSSEYEPFAYDWRLDIRYNARRLLELMQRSPGDRWHLLGHSQGCLVAIAASLLCRGTEEWHSMTARMCLVAPPLVGTLNAMDAIIRGNNFGNINSKFFQRAARTWPAIFQMFPQFACVENKPTARSTSESLWPDEDESFYRLLLRAKRYMQWINDMPFRHSQPDRVMVVLGRNPLSNTHISVQATADGPQMTFATVRGDTLVPYDRTVELLNWSGMRNRLMTLSGPHQPDHFRLLGDARIFHKCDTFLHL